MVTPSNSVEGRSLKQLAIDWAFNQSVPVILLFFIAAALWYGGSYALTTAIPEHLRQIQAGYKEIKDDYTRDLDRVLENAEQERTFHREMLKEVGNTKRVAGAEPK